MRSHTLLQSDGVRIRCLEWGSAAAPCLLLHGFDEDAHSWEPFAPRLAQRLSVWAPDLRGHGESDWSSDGEYGPERLLLDLESMCSQWGLRSIIIIGHSLGGQLALQFACRNPEIVRALIVIDSPLDGDLNGTRRLHEEAQSLPSDFAYLEEYVQYLQHRYPLASYRAVLERARNVARRGKLVRRTDPMFLNHALLNANADLFLSGSLASQRWAALSRITCSALLVRGNGSSVLSRSAAERMLHALGSRAKLVEIYGAGHAVPMDQPEELWREIEHFLDCIERNENRGAS
jgi:pimeloyl-ACP methyl ester carboxylesterase